LEFYPAPAWGIDVADWPIYDTKPRHSALDIWWLDRFPTNYAANSFARPVEAGRDFTIGELYRELKIELPHGTETPILESIGPERIQFGKETEECLVVRLRYSPDKRFMVRLLNPPPAPDEEQEHRFYTEAGKYTGVFRGLKASRLKELAASLKLELIDVNALKK